MTEPPRCSRCADLDWHEGELQRQAARAVMAEKKLTEALASLRERTAEREALINRVSKLEEQLAKINDIRNSIIGTQKLDWSEHVYPLVAALNAAGVVGMPYPEARENHGTLLERAAAAERERDEARAALEESEHAMHMRIRAGYDQTVTDSWRAALAKVEAERDEARAQLAALREAWTRYDRSCGVRQMQDPDARIAWDRAISDTAAAAEAHERRVRAEALREAADAIEARGEATRHPWMLGPSKHNPDGTVLTEAGAARCDEARWLRSRADEMTTTDEIAVGGCYQWAGDPGARCAVRVVARKEGLVAWAYVGESVDESRPLWVSEERWHSYGAVRVPDPTPAIADEPEPLAETARCEAREKPAG